MDKNELLKRVVDSVINENDADAKDAFKQYATLKAREVLEGVSQPAKAEEVVEPVVESDAETIAKEILDADKAE